MKNFTKKLALLLVFAMVLGVVSPTIVAKADGQTTETKKVVLDFKNLTLKVKAGSTYYAGYEYAQLVQSDAPTEDKIKAIKDKDWLFVDPEDRAGSGSAAYGDISWFNKKKDSYAVVRFYEDGKYTYIWSDKIEAQTEAFKVFYSTSQEGEKTAKNPAYTSAQAIGTPKSGYLVFYTGKGDSMKVVTPSVLSFRVDGSYLYKDVLGKTNVSTTGERRGSYDIIDALEKGVAKGVTLQFVQMKEDGSSTEHKDVKGWPTAKEVKFKLTAQKAAPTVKADITHVIGLKAGQEYRIVNANTGKYSAWVSVDDAHGEKDSKGKVKVGKLLLEDLVVTTAGVKSDAVLEDGFATTAGKLNPEKLAAGLVKLQVRTAKTDKAVASRVGSIIVTQQAISATSAASVTGAEGVDVSIDYTVSYDPAKGLTIKNNLAATGDTYEFTFTTSGASVTADNKWTAVKGTKSAAVKTLADSKSKEAYTKIWVRKVGDKKTGILSSNMVGFDLSGVTKVTQTIPDKNDGTVTGVSGSSVVVTSAGAVTVTIPKSAVSGAAIKDKTVDISVINVKEPGTLKWKTKGSAKAFSLDAPTFKDNKVSFKIKEIKADTTGDSGEYVCEVQSLTLKVKIVIGN